MRSLSMLVGVAIVGSIALAQSDRQPGASWSQEEIDAIAHAVELFEAPERSAWQQPDLVLEMIGIERGQQVADLGAGTGYFVPLLSRAVGEEGKVFAVDTSPHMLDYIEGRRDIPYDNVETILAEPDDARLPAGKIALVLVVNTWQYIDDRVVYLKKLAGALEPPSGRVAIIDWRDRAQAKGPVTRLARSEVVAEFEQANWELVFESDALPYQYFLVFRLPPSDN